MRKALVTGGARGIGRGLAAALAADGMHVILGVRDPERGRAAAAAMGGHVEATALDMASSESIAQCAARIAGPLDLVNNAGLYQAPPARLWPVNVRGPILLTRALDGACPRAPGASTMAAGSRGVRFGSIAR